ncbi:unnamed protein product [Didymodactylos carnosus]|uniref:Microsomal glutathione S-transferase 1 n=1 Tax=Didymodactylos carnosus TaxID=1234261 RepID=A0A813XX16_9BILA|nr:unnamed protein product [Didymodactylos carnosus]CAF3661406.1 unnamed protein product [Didymodactylos carnosus]
MRSRHALRFSSVSAFANPEDTLGLFGTPKGQLTLADPDVERVRRNHLNDIENIIPFVLIGIFYVAINPNPYVALWHFRVFFLSRIIHTIAYQTPLPQPSRAMSFLVGLVTTVSMAIQVLLAI